MSAQWQNRRGSNLRLTTTSIGGIDITLGVLLLLAGRRAVRLMPAQTGTELHKS